MECEFCREEIDYTEQCEKCGNDIHEQCLENNNLCPYCYDEEELTMFNIVQNK